MISTELRYFALTVAVEMSPIGRVKDRLQKLLITGNSEIDQVMNYLLQGEGKMLRPRLVYAVAALQEHDEEVVRDIAAALEIIHMASLVHDDIIDRADTRRNRPSLNYRFGNQVSVLTGDYLFAAAFRLINQHNQAEVMSDVTGTIQQMCSGEIKQMASLFDINVTEADYYERVFAKTACLFACCCRSAASAASLSPGLKALLNQYGLCLGFAYQIVDDVLDFVADSKLLGKPTASDLSSGNLTLPVILALQDPKEGARLRNMLTDGPSIAGHIGEIMEILVRTRALRESIAASKFFVQSALSCLDEVPAGAGRDQLHSLSHYLLDGYYANLVSLDQDDWRYGTGITN